MSNLPSKEGENNEQNDKTSEKKQQSEIPTKDQASLKGQQFGCENYLINPFRAFYCCSDIINGEKYEQKQALTFSNEFLQVIFISDAFLSYRGRNQAQIIEMQTQKQYRIQRNSIYSSTFDIKTTGVELLRLLPQENKKQQLNHESGTFLIFYYFRSGLKNIDKLQSSKLQNHLKQYLFMLDYNYKIFGSKDFQLEEDFEKFQLLYQYLISFDVPEELILDSLDVVAACILLSEQDETVNFDKKFLTPCDDQFNSVTLSTQEFDKPSDRSLGQILKLKKDISLQQLQEIGNSFLPSAQFIGKDNIKASIYYNYEILWNFIKSTINNKVFQSINSQCSRYYVNENYTQVFYEPATYVFNQKEKIYDLNFPDFVSNFVNDFLDEQFRKKGFNSLNERIYQSLFFQKFQSGQQFISSLQKLNDFDQKFSINNWEKDWIMMKSDANQSIYYQLTGFQEQNCYQLNQNVRILYEQSSNQLLQKFRPNQSITLLIHIQKQIADILNFRTNIIQIPSEQFCLNKVEDFCQQQQCQLSSHTPCQQEFIIPEIQRRKHVSSCERERNSLVSIYGGVISNDSFLFDDDLPVSYDTKPTTTTFTHSSCSAGVGSNANIQISAEMLVQGQIWEEHNDAFFEDNQNFGIQNQLQPFGQVFQLNEHLNNQMEIHFQEQEGEEEEDEQEEETIDDINYENENFEIYDGQIDGDQIQFNQFKEEGQNGEDIDSQSSEKLQYEKD